MRYYGLQAQVRLDEMGLRENALAQPTQVVPRTNADVEGRLLEEIARPEAAGKELLAKAADRFGLTARGYHRVLRVARTLADLEGVDTVRRADVAEALSYRLVSLEPA